MIGKEYKSEKYTYKDEKTGREIVKLTSGGTNNYHFYFTDNSFTLGGDEIYFLSNRGSANPSVHNVFRMDLRTGNMLQLTDEEYGVGGHTKTPDSEYVVYISNNKLRKLNTRTGAIDTIYEANADTGIGAPFVSPDKKYAGMCKNERIKVEKGPNYKGFKESMYRTKRSWITLAYLDGSKAFDVWEDTHSIAHFQFAPDDSTLASYCHEGPWNLVHQRIWLLDLVTRSVKPCFRQEEDDCVGHELWTRDGLIFFDNRRKGHDGTITSHRTQATVQEVDSDQKPYVGFADKNGDVVKTIDMPFYCNHYHVNKENTLLVGDEVDDLVLIDISKGQAEISTLCNHGTSWHTGRTHAHPTFSWENDKILFASDRDGIGQCNLYMVTL